MDNENIWQALTGQYKKHSSSLKGLNRFVKHKLSDEYYGIRREGNSLMMASGGYWKVFLKEI